MADKGSGKKAQSFTSRLQNVGAPKGKGKGKGSKPVVLGGSDTFPRRDTGKTPAKRQTQRDHGTNRRGGGSR
jgi:hypothetical protein